MSIDKCKDLLKRRTRNMLMLPRVEKIYVLLNGDDTHVAFILADMHTDAERGSTELMIKRMFNDIDNFTTYVYNPNTHKEKLRGYIRIWRKGYGF